MGSAGTKWDSSDVATAARMNQKTKKIDAGANVNAETTHAGMDVLPTANDGSLVTNHEYTRNAANSAWLEKPTLSSLTHSAGDIIKDNGTDWARFAKGTAGQVLRVNSGATDIAWETLSGVMVSISRDNTGGSAACTGTQVTAASYSLAANSYTSIHVVATGKWADVYDAGEDPSSFDVTIDIGGTTKTFTFNPPQFTAGQVSDNTGDWRWSVQFSAALTAGGTIAVKGDHDGTASRTITCDTLYVWGII